MDSLAVQITKMNLSEEFYFRDVLSNESEFLEETKEKFEKEFNTTAECYNSRKVMALSVELSAAPNVEISTKINFLYWFNFGWVFWSKKICIKLVGARVIWLIKERLQMNTTWLNFLGWRFLQTVRFKEKKVKMLWFLFRFADVLIVNRFCSS